VLTVTPVLPFDPGTRQQWPGSAFTITDPAKVARIAAVIDALPELPPGVYDCPFGTGSAVQLTSMQLTFRITLSLGAMGLDPLREALSRC